MPVCARSGRGNAQFDRLEISIKRGGKVLEESLGWNRANRSFRFVNSGVTKDKRYQNSWYEVSVAHRFGNGSMLEQGVGEKKDGEKFRLRGFAKRLAFLGVI